MARAMAGSGRRQSADIGLNFLQKEKALGGVLYVKK